MMTPSIITHLPLDETLIVSVPERADVKVEVGGADARRRRSAVDLDVLRVRRVARRASLR